MFKKILAGTIIALMLCTGACASDSDTWTSYFALGWDVVCEYAAMAWDGTVEFVMSWFTDDEASSGDKTLPGHVATNWNKLTGTLSDALELRDKQESLPQSSWLPFTEDQASNAKKINALLDRAVSLLVTGNAGEMRRESNELRSRIQAQRVELDDLRNKRITAPEKSRTFWTLTREKADKKIAELEASIRRDEETLDAVNSKLAASLREIGLELNDSQIEILMNSVTGDELTQNVIIFSNVKSVVEKLEELAQNDTNSIEITRRYTGMYLVLNDLLIYTQEELIRKIDAEYLPRLNEIIIEAENLRKDALSKSKQSRYTQTQRKSFAMNADSNAMTIRVARVYIELLNSQRGGMLTSIKSLRLNRDLAENTYKTVKGSEELRTLIHSGLGLLDAVNELKMPALKIFESDAMRIEFEKINGRLKR